MQKKLKKYYITKIFSYFCIYIKIHLYYETTFLS